MTYLESLLAREARVHRWLLIASLAALSWAIGLMLTAPRPIDPERVDRLERMAVAQVDYVEKLASVAADQAEALLDHADLHDDEEEAQP